MMRNHRSSPSDRQYSEESVLLKKVIEWLEPQKRDGIKVMRIVDRYTKGYSDLFICARGRFVVAELKDNTGTATPHQELFIKDVIACGGIGGVCRSIKDVSDLIDKAVYCQCGYIESKYCPHCGKEIRR
jgi:hypothetical protein